MKSIFSYFKKHPGEAESYGRIQVHPANQESIANRVCANRLGNGNVDYGDGWKYLGRGLIQTTGSSNYRKAQKSIDNIFCTKVDLEKNPGLVSGSEAMTEAVAYWSDVDIWSEVEQAKKESKSLGEINKVVTRKVN